MQRQIDFVKNHHSYEEGYGVLPSQYVGSNFDPLWDPIMLFHDSLEHFFETQKYFKRQFAFNIAGEITAMGILFYLNEIGAVYNRLEQAKWFSPEKTIMNSTHFFMEDSIRGNFVFGDQLLCNVPYQKPINSYLEDCILEQYKKLRKIRPLGLGIEYKKSVTLGKLQRLYRYGYRLGQKHYQNTWKNRNIINKYWDDLNSLTKYYQPEDFNKLIIKLNTGKKFSYKIIIEDYEENKEVIYKSVI